MSADSAITNRRLQPANPSKLSAGLALALLASMPACAAEPKEVMNLLDILNPDQLTSAAIVLAATKESARHEPLRAALASEELLLRFNPVSQYSTLRPDQLRLAGVLKTLGTNSSTAAADTLSHLAASPVFLAEESRQELLLRALATARTASPPVVKFFEQQIAPEATHLHLAIDSLIADGDPSLIGLLEDRLAAGVYEPEDVGGWMRDAILRHRQDVPLLEACDRLLRGERMSEELKIALVEALFDYRPADWYPPDSDRPKPPGRATASDSARTVIRRIGEWAATQETLPGKLKARVARELKSLE